MRVEVFWNDIRFTAVFETASHHVDFRAHPQIGEQDGQVLYNIRDSDTHPNPTPLLEQAEWFVNGTVKWDDCSHLTFNTEECMWHSCTRKQIEDMSTLLLRVYDECKRLMGDAV